MKGVLEAAAHQFANSLRNRYGDYLVGPAEPVVARVRNQYLMELLIKLPKDNQTILNCKRDVQEQVALMHQDKRFKSVIVVPDVDN